MHKKLTFTLAIVLSLSYTLMGQQWSDTLYINHGLINLDTIGGVSFPYISVNNSASFSQRNHFAKVQPGTPLNLTIINNDSVGHTIHLNQGQFSTGMLGPGQSNTLNIGILSQGIYELSDSVEEFRFLGLSTFFVVWPDLDKDFFWHLNEHQSNLNLALRNGMTVDLDTFMPNYFTINDQVHPQIMSDSIARVTGQVGDSILIYVHNSGKMHHAVHFHGYHVEILYSNGNPLDINRLKDSIGILPGKSQVYLLVPFQDGIYPVHDHNLVATTGGGNYPNGMMVMMNISP